jgi:hypothetical protein
MWVSWIATILEALSFYLKAELLLRDVGFGA